MIERALLTAGIVVFIIGGLARLGEGAANMGAQMTCAFQPGSESCTASPDAATSTNAEGTADGGNTAKRRTKTSKQRQR
ncbi:MAG: hypothetical protein AAGL18_09495 [Pseudomonadota bacterium]